MTDAQVQAIIEMVRESGARRLRNFGTEFNEVDFLAGAMTVFFALETQDKIPPLWILGPMSGRCTWEDTPFVAAARRRNAVLCENADEIVSLLKDIANGVFKQNRTRAVFLVQTLANRENADETDS